MTPRTRSARRRSGPAGWRPPSEGEIIDELRGLIAQRKLHPSERIDPRWLSAYFSASRNTARRVIKALEKENLVITRPGVGTFVIAHRSDKTPLAENLRQRRRDLKLSEARLAALVGTSRERIRDYELSRDRPELTILVSLAQALETSVDWLLGVRDAPAPQPVSANPDSDASEELRTFKLQLLENAYGFINESIGNAERSVESVVHWKYAIINAAQAVELFLKERLRREHSLLLFMNLDKPRRQTVGLDQAVERLRYCGVELDEEDLKRLRSARDLRNSLVHFEVEEMAEAALRAAFVDLFEFAHVFHERELGGELHDHVGSQYWMSEAALVEEFRREYVTYQGEEVQRKHPAELLDAQFLLGLRIGGRVYPRIKYGDEVPYGGKFSRRACGDCAALRGQLHAPGCDIEQCPRCRGQALSCDCEVVEYQEVDEIPDISWEIGDSDGGH